MDLETYGICDFILTCSSCVADSASSRRALIFATFTKLSENAVSKKHKSSMANFPEKTNADQPKYYRVL